MFSGSVPSLMIRACGSSRFKISAACPKNNIHVKLNATFSNPQTITLRNIHINHQRRPVTGATSFCSRSPSRPPTFFIRRLKSDTSDEHVDFCSPKTAEKLRLRDGMSKRYTLIYRSDFSRYLVLAQIAVVLSTLAFTLSMLYRLYMETWTEEEIQEIKEKQIQKILEVRRQENESEYMKIIAEYQDETTASMVNPAIEDLLDQTPLEFAVIIIAFLGFALSLWKLLRMTPCRIYMNNKDHCVAIMYGHVLPGQIVHHEFVAGTVRPMKKYLALHVGTCYTDGSGRPLVLMDRFFRTPADYNRLLGYEQEFQREEIVRRMRKDAESSTDA